MPFSHVLTNPRSSTLSLYSSPLLTSPPLHSFPLPLLFLPSSSCASSFGFCVTSITFSHLPFFPPMETWKRKSDRWDNRNNGGRGGYGLWDLCSAYASLLIFWFVWVFQVLSLSVGVFVFVCCCLPLVFDVTLGRPAGLKQQPAEAWRHFEPNIETWSGTRQSHAICPSLPNKVSAIILKKEYRQMSLAALCPH